MTTVFPAKDEVERRELCANLTRLAQWCQSKDDTATIWLHAIQAREYIAVMSPVDRLREALEAVDEMFSNPGRVNKNSVRDKVRAALSSPEPMGEANE